jgi:hypothetical protein
MHFIPLFLVNQAAALTHQVNVHTLEPMLFSPKVSTATDSLEDAVPATLKSQVGTARQVKALESWVVIRGHKG